MRITGRWYIDPEHGRDSKFESKRVSPMIAGSEASIWGIIQHLSERFIMLDDEFNVVRVNDKYAEFIGLNPAEIIGQSIKRIHSEWERLPRFTQIVRVMETGESVEFDDSKDLKALSELTGTEIGFAERGKIFRIGPYTAMLSSDISEQYLLENELLESNSATQALLDASTESALLMDKSGVIIAANEVVAKRLMSSPKQLIGKNVFELLPEELSVSRQKKINNVFQSSKPERFQDERNGRVYKNNVFPVVNSSGKVSQVALFAHDVTDVVMAESEQNFLEKQLRQLQKMETLGTLASGIAHDFNNILTPIIGFTDLAIKKLSIDHPSLKYLRRVGAAGSRAKALVKQILTFSRQVEQEKKPIYLHHVMLEVNRLLKSTLSPDITIKRDLDAHCGEVLADPSQIHQVIMNLCANAIQAMKQHGGTLTMKLKLFVADDEFLSRHPKAETRDFALIEIMDTGCGIDSTSFNRIFDPFFTTRKRQESTGLGLAIVHGIISNHDGIIEVQSEVEKGSIFKVYLPMVHNDAYLDLDLREIVMSGTEHILIVDDEIAIVDLLNEWLKDAGYELSIRSSSSDALELFKNKPYDFDIVITDMAMPFMNGTQLAREIKKIRPEIPIILMTGFSSQISLENIAQYGINDLVMKPIVVSELSRIIRKLLDHE